MSRAPSGGGVSPAVTLSMRPSTMVIVDGPAIGWPGSASRWPAWTTVTCCPARDGVGWASAGSANRASNRTVRRAIMAIPLLCSGRLHGSSPRALTSEKPGAAWHRAFLLPREKKGLPEEIVDRVEYFAGIDVHQQHVVIVAHPLRARGRRRQPIVEGIADPVAAAEEQRIQEEADREAPIAP